jgi:hypothetical protein
MAASAVWRQVALRASSIVIGTLAGAFCIGLGLAGYLTYCRVAHVDVDLRVRRQPLIRRALTSKSYLELMKALSMFPTQWFRTSWDLDKSVALSKELYVPTRMDGVQKYRYRPSIRMLDFTVWSGLDRRSFVVRAKPRMIKAVHECPLLREVYYETDARGFKRSLPEDDGSPAVLFVGDSFTEGLHVASEDTFVTRYGERLRTAGLRVNVVNGGVNGYGVSEEAWTVEEFASALGARVIVVNLFPNDVVPDFRMLVRAGAHEESYEEMFRHLKRIRNFSLGRDALLIVAALPPEEQLGLKGSESLWQARVARWCSREGVLFVDPLPRFRELGARNVYFGWDPHLNESGHRHYADWLASQTIDAVRLAVEDRATPRRP